MNTIRDSITIIPDVHGRGFWKYAVKGKEEQPIIFLGDYLDPYPQEDIDSETAFEEFQAIVEFKKAHDGNVTLLLGNHDLQYISRGNEASRYDSYRAFTFHDFFEDNADLFHMAYQCEDSAGRQYLLTHAGVHPGWVKAHPEVFRSFPKKSDNLAGYLNNLASAPETKEGFNRILRDVSYVRMGWHEYGSMVWADVEEYAKAAPLFPDLFQVFGHTQLMNQIITRDYACLDCHAGFTLDREGNFHKIL